MTLYALNLLRDRPAAQRMQKEGPDPNGRRAHYASKLADILRADDVQAQLAAHSAGDACSNLARKPAIWVWDCRLAAEG